MDTLIIVVFTYISVLVACSGQHVVYATDRDAVPVMEIGGHGQHIGEFDRPTGITSDGDVLLVADSCNNRIQVVDYEDCYIICSA